ncbi:sugar-binding transcriptional regulator [Pontivivens insulae]|nr:sugar-binding transcriptional regulator [Pontivivens insulae]
MRLDDAARAGWLYYVAGKTQDEIARQLGVSRQTVQRLVSVAINQRLIKVRMEHPIARCMELGQAIQQKYGLDACDVVPTDPSVPKRFRGVALAGAAELELALRKPEPIIVSMGTGRVLRALVEELPELTCPQHRIVSRLGNVMSNGSATPFNVVVRLADKVGAPHWPMSLPVLAETAEERRLLHSIGPIRATLDLCARADVSFVGIGQMNETAPALKDGFLTDQELDALRENGAVGEITSFVYNAQGQLLTGPLNARVVSAPLPSPEAGRVIGIGTGLAKIEAILGALRGHLISEFITDEATAQAVLDA